MQTGDTTGTCAARRIVKGNEDRHLSKTPIAARITLVAAFFGVAFLLAVIAPGAYATTHVYQEDFTTTQYKDPLNTTAWWNTVAGELKLYPLPLLAGSYDTPDLAWGVAISGDYAYVADGTSGLQVIDISDPTAPTLAGSYDTPGTAYGVAISGDYAYVADGFASFQVIDISDPTAPTLAGTHNTTAYGVAISGDYAYVVRGNSGLYVIDISDPTYPTFSGACDTPDFATGVAISGDYAYVADGTSGLQVIDISDPTAPTLAGSRPLAGANDVAISGDHAYVASGYSTLYVISIANPTAPVLQASVGALGSVFGVAISGGHAYLAGSSGLYVIDIGNPRAPTLAGTCNTPGNAKGVAISGDHAYVADGSSGLQVIDISDPTPPTLSGSYGTPGTAFGVAISGTDAFVADYGTGLQVIDIRERTAPTLTGSYDTPGSALGVAISGNYAYVADYGSGLQVINISNRTAPTLAGSYNTPGTAFGVAISGDHAYVADYGSGLQVIDISDPTAPTLAGSYNTPGEALGVAIAGDHAYVADYGSGLQVIDISDPTAPTLSGSYDTPGTAVGVAIAGDHAYVADYDFGLQVIRVFQSEVDSDNNIGRSLVVDASDDTILKARLLPTQTGPVVWELSADGGMSWQGISPDGTWSWMTVPGTDLLWRSTHSWVAPGGNPGVTQLEIDWLYEAAPIDAIVDVPDDQGRSVNLSFTRSVRDFLDETAFPVVGYAIYRRLDDPLLVQQVMNQPAVSTDEVLDHPQLASFDPDGVRRLADRTFIVGGAEATVGTLPPGVWEGVGWLLPTQSDSYTLRVNTLADSTVGGTDWSVFVTAVHTSTPSVWYVSDPDSGYSVDNIAPAVPEGFGVAYNTGSGNQLSWDPCPDADFQYFNIYRSTDPNFGPSPSDLVHSTSGTDWNDPEYDGWAVYYKVTALDLSGNESDPASAGTATVVTEPVIPQTFGLYPNVPNPFNPTTVIRYDVPPSGGAVTLRVYDVGGRLVRTLVDGPQTAGQKTAVWNGRDNRGRGVASGVYFYRLQAPGYEKTLKMVLVQ